MSQIGKKPIDLPDNVKIDLQDTQISVSKDNKQLFCKTQKIKRVAWSFTFFDSKYGYWSY